MNQLPQLMRVLINLSSGNSKIWGTVSAPMARTGSEAFGPPQRMLHARRGSVAQPGDTVMDLGERYVLGYFSKTANDEIFRMFILHFSADVMRAGTGKDPVTGFDRGGKPVKVGTAWFDRKSNGSSADVDSLKRTKYRIITGFPLEVGDHLDGLKITGVTTELGVTIAEAE
jgi:hypothetical protein